MTTVVDCWTPGRVVQHLKRGWIVPADWRQILRDGRFYGWSELGLPVPWTPIDGDDFAIQGTLDLGAPSLGGDDTDEPRPHAPGAAHPSPEGLVAQPAPTGPSADPDRRSDRDPALDALTGPAVSNPTNEQAPALLPQPGA